MMNRPSGRKGKRPVARRSKTKRGRSFTSTKTTTKRRFTRKGGVRPRISGLSWVRKIGFGKMKEGRGPKAKYTHQQQTIIHNDASGAQGLEDINQFLNYEHFNLAPSAPNSAETSRNAWSVNVFDMQPDQNKTGGVLYDPQTTTTTSTARANDRAVIHDIQGTYHVTNFQSTLAEVTLYWVSLKNSDRVNGSFYPQGYRANVQEWIEDILANETESLKTAYTNPYNRTAAVAPSMGDTKRYMYGFNPWSLKKFRDTFKMVSKKKLSIAGGDTKKVNFRMIYNRMFDKFMFNSNQIAGGTPYNVRNTTVYCFAIVRGAPVLATTTSPVGEVVTPGPYKVGFQMTYSVDVTYPANKQTRTDVQLGNYNFSAQSTGLAVINPETEQEFVPVDAGN